jgi:hypothetical protein
MIETLLSISIVTLAVTSFLSILAGVAWLRLDDETLYEETWPTDGITREPKQGD